MIQTLDHKILSSLKEYINYRILKDLQAYKTVSANLYKYTDERFASKNVYGSSYPFWVYDSSITTGIPSGIGTLNRGTSGLALDFKNGRAIVNSGVNLATTTVNVPVNEFYCYISTKSEMQLINESTFVELPDLQARTKQIAPDSVILPAVIIRPYSTKGEPFSLGGLDWTTYNIRVLCFTKNLNQLVALQGLIRDLKERMMPLLSSTPLNEFNDIKSSWNFESIMQNEEEKAYILDSSFQVLENDVLANNNPNLQMGIGLLKVGIIRYPRQ